MTRELLLAVDADDGERFPAILAALGGEPGYRAAADAAASRSERFKPALLATADNGKLIAGLRSMVMPGHAFLVFAEQGKSFFTTVALAEFDGLLSEVNALLEAAELPGLDADELPLVEMVRGTLDDIVDESTQLDCTILVAIVIETLRRNGVIPLLIKLDEHGIVPMSVVLLDDRRKHVVLWACAHALHMPHTQKPGL